MVKRKEIITALLLGKEKHLRNIKRGCKMKDKYTDFNSQTIDKWVEEGWEWGKPISHEQYELAKQGVWSVLLTPTKPMPKTWFPNSIQNLKVLGLASGGGQQMPIFSALGAECTVLDYSKKQIESEEMVAKREGYQIKTILYDMTNPLPFADEEFDIIFHPVSNSYIEKVEPLFQECFRILKQHGILVCGLDNGVNYISDDEITINNKLPFNPLENEEQYQSLLKGNDGIQFSHTLEEQIGGQLKAGFTLVDLFEDINGEGRLHDLNIPCFIATKSIKKPS